MFDAAIVGAGPAGAATAIHLARRGMRVVLLERTQGDRRKACGEGIFPRGLEELRRLEVHPAVDSLGAPLTGVRFNAAPYQATATFGGGSLALGMQRTDLDPLLRRRAVEVGAELRLGASVRSLVRGPGRFTGVETEDGERIEAAVIVGADGLRSRIRWLAGLDRPQHRRRYGISAHLQLPRPVDPLVDIHFHDDAEVYVTPVGPATVNVAMLFRRGMRSSSGGPTAAFRGLIQSHALLAAGTLLDVPVAAGPFPAASRRPWRDNLLLVGDAAGFVDAISGEGISTSLLSARACADAVVRYLDSDLERSFERYARQRGGLARNADLLAHLSLVLSSRPWLARHSVRNLMRQPETFRRLLGVSAGDLRVADLRPRDLLALTVGV
ncbi:MAG: hypothetical protein CVU47_09410 [Chloroflexi bacterium HGW-Chloroflexi-9]|nr:MAG: hypothetical protein CVU47_09410 [Chloroflexi bacterium HGW-Chloroflexi-9]